MSLARLYKYLCFLLHPFFKLHHIHFSQNHHQHLTCYKVLNLTGSTQYLPTRTSETNTQPATMATNSSFTYSFAFNDTRVREWYTKDGQVDSSTFNTQQRQAAQILKLIDGQLPTPLQIMVLIQQDDPVTHNPNCPWPVYLPMICPITIAQEEVLKHFYRYNHNDLNMSVTKPIKALPPFTMTSKKLAFGLGYMLQVLWVKVKRPELWDTRDDRDDKEESFFRSSIHKWLLAQFVEMLCQAVWKQRLLTTASAPQAQAGRSTVGLSSTQEIRGGLDSEMPEEPRLFEFEA